MRRRKSVGKFSLKHVYIFDVNHFQGYLYILRVSTPPSPQCRGSQIRPPVHLQHTLRECTLTDVYPCYPTGWWSLRTTTSRLEGHCTEDESGTVTDEVERSQSEGFTKMGKICRKQCLLSSHRYYSPHLHLVNFLPNCRNKIAPDIGNFVSGVSISMCLCSVGGWMADANLRYG